MPATAPERERHGEPGSARQRGQGWRSTSSASLITSVRVGYARCSTATQELQSQLDALEPVCFEVFHEKVSTRVKVWPQYEKAVAMARRFKELHPNIQVILTVHEFRRLGRGTDLLVTVEDLRKAGIALEFLSGPVTGLYDPGDRHGQGAILFGVLAALSGAERTYTREDLVEISLYITENINRFGEYSTHELGIVPDAYEPHLDVDFTKLRDGEAA
ncbi:recombinase family protein [Streptomyces sp. NPDC051644]|uniref:recombinase family protein n=1 Tax=Streptomyces sp. NPDC051644 TaxID=3365666 RepID=UPI0037990F14